MKKLASILLSLTLLFTLTVPALAAGTGEFDFDILVDGESSASVEVGDTITVSLVLSSTDGAAYDLYNMQDYIRFDTTYLEFVDDSISVYQVPVEIPYSLFSASGSESYVFVNRTPNTAYAIGAGEEIQVVSFQLEAVKTGGTSVTHMNIEMLTQDNVNQTVNASTATVTISSKDTGSSGTGSSGSSGSTSSGSTATSTETTTETTADITTSGDVTVETTTETTTNSDGSTTTESVETATNAATGEVVATTTTETSTANDDGSVTTETVATTSNETTGEVVTSTATATTTTTDDGATVTETVATTSNETTGETTVTTATATTTTTDDGATVTETVATTSNETTGDVTESVSTETVTDTATTVETVAATTTSAGDVIAATTTVIADTATATEITATVVSENGATVTAEIVAVATADTTDITIPQAVLTSVAAEETAVITVETPVATIELCEIATNTVAEAVAASEEAEVVISAVIVEQEVISSAISADLNNIVVVDLTVSVGTNTVSHFDGGTALVTIPYTAVNENAPITLYYVADDGSVTMMDCTYDAESSAISFETSHFSYYMVSENTAISFTDVGVNAYYYDAVKWAVDNGITSGVTDTTFVPETTCTRAQAVTFLYRAAGSPEVVGDSVFTDVAADAWYYDAVVWAVENGITTGMTDTTFAPDATCSRSQIVTFMYRLAGEPDVTAEASFADVDADAYYANSVLWAVENAITTGTADTTFSPDADCTRGQIVTFLYRYLG